MLFDSWAGLGRVLLVGTLAYVALVLLLRVSGKRTLTKLNAFDLVVTVALGSTLATVLLSKSVAFAEGVLAIGLLISLQYAIAWLSVRSPRFQAMIKAEPTFAPAPGSLPRTGAAVRAHHARRDPGGVARERRRRTGRHRRGRPGNRRHLERHPGRRPQHQHSHARQRAPARGCSGVIGPIRQDSGRLDSA